MHVVDLRHGQAFLVELLEEIGDKVAVEDRNRGALGVKAAPVGSGEVEKVLEEDAVTDEVLMADSEEFEVRGAGYSFGDVRFVWEKTFEPKEEFAFGELNVGALVWDKAVNGCVVTEEPVSLVDLDDGEAAVWRSCGGLIDDILYNFHFLVTELEGGVDHHLGEGGSLGRQHASEVLRKFGEVVVTSGALADDFD